MAGVMADAFTCVGWQVTLCDPMRQVTSRSSEMDSHEELYSAFTIFTFNSMER